MIENTPVTINGKTYYLKSGPSHVESKQIAAYVDSRMQELSRAKAAYSTFDLAILTALNIAGELIELQGKYQADKEALEQKAEYLVQKLILELESIKN